MARASKPKLRRETLLPALAMHVLVHGLANASLRPMAKAVGTSDRMLLYHFGTKDALIADILGELSRMFSGALEAAFPDGRASSREDCISRVLSVTSSNDFQHLFRVWWEIVAGSSRGEAAYLEPAGQIMDELLQWVVDHLPLDDPDPQTGARMVLTYIEGAQMLIAVGRGDIAAQGFASLAGKRHQS